MAKKGMKRMDHTQEKNAQSAVPVLQGKGKSEKPISTVYTAVDTDLARDNLENDITAADLQDL